MPLGNKNKNPFTQYSSKNSLTLVRKPYKTQAWPGAAILSLPLTSPIHSLLTHSAKLMSPVPAKTSRQGPFGFSIPSTSHAKYRLDLGSLEELKFSEWTFYSV